MDKPNHADDPRRDREGACGAASYDEDTLPNGRVSEKGRSEKGRSEKGRSEKGRSEKGRVLDKKPSDSGGSFPLAYLITFTTYGTWLHGDNRGSVDPAHNIPGSPYIEPDPQRHRWDHRKCKHPCITLNAKRRAVVQDTIIEVTRYRDWTLHTLNIRTNHVHMVISADETPDRVMNVMKSWATRRMVESSVLATGTKAWARHGSTRYLWKQYQVEAACRYVREAQGIDLEWNGSYAP